MFALRLHKLLAFPVFIDEGSHLLRAQRVFEFADPTASFLPGKLLTYYYLGIFTPQNHNALWIGWAAITLLAPLAAVLCYAIVRRLKGSFRGGLLTIWLYALVPLLFLFDRLAMSDTLVMTLGLAVVWSSLLLVRHPDVNQGAATGFLLGLMLLAKLTALPLIIVPILALVLFGKIQLKPLVVCYVVMGPSKDSPIMLHCLYIDVPSHLGGHRITEEWIQATEEAGAWYFLVDAGADRTFRNFAEDPIQLTRYGRPDKSGELTLYLVPTE